MEMLRSFRQNEHIANAKQVVYKHTYFPNGFARFLGALQVEQLVTDDTKCSLVNEGGYRWVNNVKSGGILVETTTHPYINNNKAGNLIITGPVKYLEIVHSIVERHQVSYTGAPKRSEVEFKVEYHDHLNPKLWRETESREFELDSKVSTALEDIAQSFYEFLDIPNLPIEDVVITGSSANYNWTKFSDIDLHLIIDMEAVEKKLGRLAPLYFTSQKKLWNTLHDISIREIPVEVYIQDQDEVHNSTGVYSISNDEWIIKPEYKEPDVDNSAVKAKAAEWISNIRDLGTSNKADPIENFMKKLSKHRQAGLDKGGEFSVENLAFKVLRNEGWLDKLADLKNRIYDRKLSIEDEELWACLR